jgi:hypothetical protein
VISQVIVTSQMMVASQIIVLKELESEPELSGSAKELESELSSLARECV